jgi:hypothetical protein
LKKQNETLKRKGLHLARLYEGEKDWIHYRICMAAGDVQVHEKNFDKALEYYEFAKIKYDNYEGEGHNYQINPRIGLAYLHNGMVKGRRNF